MSMASLTVLLPGHKVFESYSAGVVHVLVEAVSAGDPTSLARDNILP